ncbi:hypothetical protein PFLUV_G00089460 [Perca fluviatilis]|uniref:Uncharacterized protein n=1 Tax=Perca fluviatilis TaxID=8168 RepID=A0A6A5F8P3_PERFL|nr:uncharacterized protein LOC120561638 [Perca fluviatilis]XP_039660735.1 uncharacterized protein LOC120561638 [Perca fluviatilis]KAF1388368.1 hypothetical protein PFLUV_G00089460 [Perca fluviatilis]
MIPQFPLQSVSPLGADTTLLNIAAKNGNTNKDKAGAGRKKLKTKVGDPSKWNQNKQKQLRMEGKSYVSKRKKDGEVVTKQPRAMGPRCTSTACKKASNRLCNEINEEARKKVFDEFWQHMNWAQRKLYVSEQVDRDPVERSRAVGAQSRRSVSLRYHLMVDGRRKQVCKNMFLSTLGIGEWSVLNWTQKGATTKNESSENNLEKRQAVPQCPQQIPASSAVSNTAEVTQEQGNAPDKDKDRPPEPEGSARKKSRVAKPQTWKHNRQKQLRMEGKPYISKRKKDGTTITKGQRTMGLRCTSGACKRASNRFCADFSEEMRNELFTSFWQCMNWAQRKTYVSGLVDCGPVERTRAPWTQSRRSVSMRYHLIGSGEKKQVCKKMFLSTLGIGEWSVLNWAQNTSQQDSSEEITKKQMQRKSRKASEHIVLTEFLESLPKVPSYCCGTSVSKLYLEPVFSNMSEVYRHYYKHCLERKTTPLSRQVFCAVFKKMDLGLCDSKRDQGCSFGGNLFNELWEEYCLERGAPGPQPEKAGNQ